MNRLKIQIFHKSALQYDDLVEGCCELGRQARPDEPVYQTIPIPPSAPRAAGSALVDCRLAIARLDETGVSRRHISLEELPDRRVRVTNISENNVIVLADQSTLLARESIELPVPVILLLKDKQIQVDLSEPEGFQELRRLNTQTMVPGELSIFNTRPLAATAQAKSLLEMMPEHGVNSLVDWLQSVTAVLQAATGSHDFFDRAAAAIVQLVGLETGVVVLYENGEWRPKSISSGSAPGQKNLATWQPSRKILSIVRAEKRTVWQVPREISDSAPSLVGISAVVAAPILDRNGAVIGALYGDRHAMTGSGDGGISRVEAMLVETLAYSVATGLARVEQEEHLARQRVQFEQFFTRELADYLASDPTALEGREAEVSLMFCDMRGFSRISHAIGPNQTFNMISDVMNLLSDCVRKHHGVLVDFIGDEMFAMWGAPLPQPEHARLCCRAAMEMIVRLPEATHAWQNVVREPIKLGIGINSGKAWVGNTGSTHKFKYGPLGSTVNAASRVQGATRFLRSDICITGNTLALLADREGGSSEFPVRRLCRGRLLNIPDPFDIYELQPAATDDWREVTKIYEEALENFEAERFRLASRLIGKVLSQSNDDGPSLVLLSRAVECWETPPNPFSPVWNLPAK